MALRGLKVVEMMGLAPGPLCGMILADFGADVTVIQKIDPLPIDFMSNGKRLISVDLKSVDGIKIAKKLCVSADVLIDTYRPNVMEKIGLGPDLLTKHNPKLIYARLSGFGQNGFYAHKGAHDINYVAISGILSLLGKNRNPPNPPLNLLADFAGGSLICVLGILLALFERTKSGKGQVIDCSMVEGIAYLASWIFKTKNTFLWSEEPGANILDGGKHYYCTYKTMDEKFMAIGALEPHFYKNLLKGLQLPLDEFHQNSDSNVCKKKFQEVFLTKTQQEWTDIFDKLDACVTPVLEFDNLTTHEHNISRQIFFKDNEGNIIPKPAPKLSQTPGISMGNHPHPLPGQHTIEILQELGYTKNEIDSLLENGTISSQRQSQL